MDGLSGPYDEVTYSVAALISNVRFAESDAKWYLDGVQQNIQGAPTTGIPDRPLYIGSRFNINQSPLPGVIDFVSLGSQLTDLAAHHTNVTNLLAAF